MRFSTENELSTFDFTDSYVGALQMGLGTFCAVLDNVKILETNSKNRDVRTMRTNGLELRIYDAQIAEIIEEGCKVYDADGVLQKELPDQTVPTERYADLFAQLEGAAVYGVKKDAAHYEIGMDGEEHSYTICLTGSKDREEWDRFMNPE